MSTSPPPERFPFSGLPNYLEHYKCFNDPASSKAIDGMEFRIHSHAWDEDQKKRWRFFYQPIRALVGRPQKVEIRKREASIEGAKAWMAWNHKRTVRSLVLCGIALLASLILWQPLALLPLLYEAGLYLNWRTGILRKVFGLAVLAILTGVALDTYLATLPLLLAGFRAWSYTRSKKQAEKAIEIWQQEIGYLHSEIEQLVAQIRPAPSKQEIESQIRHEIQSLEKKFLEEIVGPGREPAEVIQHDKLDDRYNPYGIEGLLIEGWAPLQPLTLQGPFGKEKTGLHKVLQNHGARAATFRVGSQGQPLYRVAYLQFVFLLEKNINVYNLFYDFVTKKRYGKVNETFQYNHVTNYSVREVDIEETEQIRAIKLPESLRRNLYGKEVNAFSLSVASGGRFRCVLVDDNVVDGLKRWLDADLRLRQVGFAAGGDPEVDPMQNFQKIWLPEGQQVRERERERRQQQLDKLSSESELPSQWARDDEQRQREIVDQLKELRGEIEDQDLHIAQRAVQHIRSAVEHYVHDVARAGLGDRAVA